MQIYIQSGGGRIGPLSIEEVRLRLQRGEVRTADLAWHEGLPEWVPIERIVGSPPPVPPSPTGSSHSQTSGLAVAGLVSGILSFVGVIFLAPVAIVLGHMARGRIKKSGGTLGGRGMATAGLILGYACVGILGIFLMVALPAMDAVMSKAGQTKTKHTMMSVITAVRSYQVEFNRFPMDSSAAAAGANDDAEIFRTDGKGGVNSVINILMAETGYAEPNMNPKKIRFMDLPEAKDGRFGIVSSGGSIGDGSELQLLDMWGEPYWIQFDTNYDNRMANPDAKSADPAIARRASENLTTSVIMFSSGPDRTPYTKDDIVSWR